jgi:hypothetical protein
MTQPYGDSIIVPLSTTPLNGIARGATGADGPRMKKKSSSGFLVEGPKESTHN